MKSKEEGIISDYTFNTDNEFYIQKAETLAAQSTKNHQGRGEEALSAEETARVIEILKNDSKHFQIFRVSVCVTVGSV